MGIKELWKAVLMRYANDEGLGLPELEASFNDYVVQVNEHMRVSLFLEEKPFTEKTLKEYHNIYTKGSVKTEPRSKSLENLLAYSRQYPAKNFLLGTWVSYQFPLAGKVIGLKNESGTTEHFVATRMVWILIPKTVSTSRVIGFGSSSNKTKYVGEAKIDGDIAFIKVREMGVDPRNIDFTLTKGDYGQMIGKQVLFQQRSQPDVRETVWKFETDKFKMLNDEFNRPNLFKTKDELPEEYRDYPEAEPTFNYRQKEQIKVLQDESEKDKKSLQDQLTAKATAITGLEKDKKSLQDQLTAKDKAITGLEKDKKSLQDQLTAKDKAVTDLTKNKKDLLILLCLSIVSLITVSVLYFRTAKELRDTQVFFDTKEGITKEQIWEKADFLDPSKKSRFLRVIDTLVRVLMQPQYSNEKDTLPIVDCDKAISSITKSRFWKHGTEYNPEEIGKMELRGTYKNDLINGMQGYLSRFYRNNPKLTDRDSNQLVPILFGLNNTDFDTDLIFIGYKKDSTDEFMFRYPRYKVSKTNYAMTSRQWWREAVDKSELHWKYKFNDTILDCGISKPYVTLRKNTPSHRTFWVNVPISSDEKTKMVLAIDLFMKN